MMRGKSPRSPLVFLPLTSKFAALAGPRSDRSAKQGIACGLVIISGSMRDLSAFPRPPVLILRAQSLCKTPYQVAKPRYPKERIAIGAYKGFGRYCEEASDRR
jgi:hypothetical protein